MSKIILTEEHMKQAVYGSSLLGGGGSGFISQGLSLGKQAIEIGEPVMATIDEFSDTAIFVMVSAVGAANEKNIFLKPAHFIRTIELIKTETQLPIEGIISSEIGPINVVNGWLQSAVTGLPIVDAPADGRGHPTAEMGLMGLTLNENHVSIQAAAGGSKRHGRYMELIVKGTIANCASTVREASIKVGGIIAVAREFITADYVKKNGCPGALTQAIEIGKALLESQSKGPESMIMVTKEKLNAELLDEGIIANSECKVERGVDIGYIEINTKTGRRYQIDAFDNFIVLESDGKRLATFPDLILLIDKETGLPITCGEATKGKEVALLLQKKENLNLGKAYKDPKLFDAIENAIKKDVKSYIF